MYYEKPDREAEKHTTNDNEHEFKPHYAYNNWKLFLQSVLRPVGWGEVGLRPLYVISYVQSAFLYGLSDTAPPELKASYFGLYSIKYHFWKYDAEQHITTPSFKMLCLAQGPMGLLMAHLRLRNIQN